MWRWPGRSIDWQARERMTPDHYATLGVDPTANAAAIRATYLALMREYHPDRNPDPVAALRAQAIIAAFKVLGDFDRRNQYDWGRRREREAAEAAAAKRPRRIRAGAVKAGAVGLAAVSAWVLMPTPTREPVTSKPEVAKARDVPAAKARPKPELKRVAAASPAKMKVEKRDPVAKVAKVEPRTEPVQMAKAKPVRVAKAGPVRVAALAKPKVERATVVRVAAVKAPAPRVAPQSPPPPPIRSAARSAPPTAKPATDLASLDQFVMNFYGQSWRYGDAPKRAALVQSRDNFVVRRGACAADECKRAAYLRLMRDVSQIVETGQPKTP